MTSQTSTATEAVVASSPVLECLHTYFLFPFALDKEAIQEDHPEAWPAKTRWIDGLDSWITGESERRASHGLSRLPPWKRASYSRFDVQSPAYADLLFFHAVVRHVFFDTTLGRNHDTQENQLRCYTIEIPAPDRLWFEGRDALGRGARTDITDLRLFLSVQGIGVLSIGVNTGSIDAGEALWINRRLRKLYPVDADGVREGRTPNWLALRFEQGTRTEMVSEERFEHPAMVGFYPPLANTVKSLLYFADYSLEEYEPVLDENMLVYSYAEMDAGTPGSAVLDATLKDFLHLGHKHTEPARFSSGGNTVLLGSTSHNCSVLRLRGPSESAGGPAGTPWALPALIRDDLDFKKTFHTRYYLMMVIALFYRAVLLDFSERTALVSRRLLHDQQRGRLTSVSINMVNDLRTELLNFCSYWHFDELSCKQTDNDVFRRLCAEYKVEAMKATLTQDLSHMGDFVYNFYQLRNTEAVNRLAMLSLIFGAGAVLTGFFGMNFSREFGELIFEGKGANALLHYGLVALVSGVVVGSLSLGMFVLLRNWRDYLTILKPQQSASASTSLKRGIYIDRSP